MTETAPPVAGPTLDALRRALPDLRLERERPGLLAASLSQDGLRTAARTLAENEARLADLFAVPDGDELVLQPIYALDREHAYLLLRSPLAGSEYDSLSAQNPAAFVEECELFELHGVRPRGVEELDRVLTPPQSGRDFPLGSHGTGSRPALGPHLVRGEAIEFPFGPVRVAGWESLYMGLVTTGEEILDLYLFHWHKHRGIERRLRGLPVEKALFFAERAEGLSAAGNGIAFCRALEAAAGIEPPPPAAATRAVALELERIYNHAAAVAALCQTTGLSVGQAHAEIALEKLLRLNLAAFGHRYLFGVVAPGGVRRPPLAAAVHGMLGPACDELLRAVEALLATNSFVDRLEACGIVAVERARRLGLVGPVARASAVSLDSRRDHPWPPYDELAVTVAGRAGGDAFSRMNVFVDELRESARLAEALLAEAGPGRNEPATIAGSGLGWAESPRGESIAWLSLDDRGRIEWARLRPAAMRNWRAFDDAARARNVFTDIPIIEASFWLTVAGFAR